MENLTIQNIIQQEVEKANQHFASYEQVKRFRLIPRTLSVERGEITPTLKLKRKTVINNYEDLVEEMYQY